MILLTIIGYILIGLGLVLGAFILIPYHYEAAGDSGADLQFRGSFSWFFGGIRINFAKYAHQNKELTLVILGIKKKLANPKGDKDKNKKDKNKKKKPKSKKGRDIGSFLKHDVIEKVLNTVAKILKHCGPKTLTVDARIGFSDPMVTGLMCAFTSQLYYLLNRYDITIQPVFDEEVFEGRFSIGGRIWLFYLILVLIGFLITKPIRNILLKNKKKHKGGPQYVR